MYDVLHSRHLLKWMLFDKALFKSQYSLKAYIIFLWGSVIWWQFLANPERTLEPLFNAYLTDNESRFIDTLSCSVYDIKSNHTWTHLIRGTYSGYCCILFHVIAFHFWNSFLIAKKITFIGMWMYQPSGDNVMVDSLTHWGRDKMAAISQTTLSDSFSWTKMLKFRLKFHWSLFLGPN